MSSLSRRDFFVNMASNVAAQISEQLPKSNIKNASNEGTWILVASLAQMFPGKVVTKKIQDSSIEIFSTGEGIYAVKDSNQWVGLKVDREGIILVNSSLEWPQGQGISHQSGQVTKISLENLKKETQL